MGHVWVTYERGVAGSSALSTKHAFSAADTRVGAIVCDMCAHSRATQGRRHLVHALSRLARGWEGLNGQRFLQSWIGVWQSRFSRREVSVRRLSGTSSLDSSVFRVSPSTHSQPPSATRRDARPTLLEGSSRRRGCGLRGGG